MPKQNSPILPYSPEKILQIREWVKDCETWLEARALISQKLKIAPDNATRMNKKHGFWKPLQGDLPEVRIERPFRRLFLDLETSPNVVLSWRIGRKVNLESSNILKERAIICACWKWEGEDEVYSVFWDKDQSDKVIVEEMFPVLAEADEIVYQNGDRFDLPWLRTRGLLHGLSPLPNYKTFDTLKVLRQKFYFNSNRLDYVAKMLGLGGKIKTEFNLWKDVVLDKNPEALTKMVEYCEHDVVLLEQVYHRLVRTVKPKSHVGAMNGRPKWSCPYCGSSDVVFVKTRTTAAGVTQYDMRCLECDASFIVSETVYQEWLESKG